MSLGAIIGAAFANDPGVCIQVVERIDRVEESIAALRAARGEVVLLVIDSGVGPLERAIFRATIGPLAIERAPETRFGAVDVAPGAAIDDVVAGLSFLIAARSTTGQILTIKPE